MNRLINFRGVPRKCIECYDEYKCKYPCKKVIDECIEKLKEYEDLEEQGLLVKLPCKSGDIVYVVGTKCLANVVSDEECDLLECDSCKYDKELVVFDKVADRCFISDLLYENNSNFIFGTTVFLTSKEAEDKLKELSEGKNSVMRNEFDKCYFCKCYNEYEGCEYGCENKTGFEPDHDKIISKAKEKNISVADVIALINM